MDEVARELYRVLEQGRCLETLTGDIRIHEQYVLASHFVLQVFSKNEFTLRGEVIKIQHKMKTTREVWSKICESEFL